MKPTKKQNPKRPPTLKELRLARRWTWFTLADRSGVSISTIARAEKSKEGWPPRKIIRKRLCLALGVEGI